jgi:hypothetical protein
VHVQRVTFRVPKQGYAIEECEDGVRDGPLGWADGRIQAGRRFAVADGATHAYAAGRWVRQLVDSFMAADAADGPAGPDLDPDSMRRWIDALQQEWQREAANVASPFEQAKIRKGSLATFVGGQILGHGPSGAAWHAVALGDVVLFHVRAGRLIAKLPDLRAADIDTTPDGISTLPGMLDQMCGQLKFGSGRLEPGDLIFIATDTLAKWMLLCDERGDGGGWLWPRLSDPLFHPRSFAQLVDEQRRATTTDDDVTLLRLRLTSRSAPPTALVMYQ